MNMEADRRNKRSKRTKSKQVQNNKWFQLLTGLFIGVTGSEGDQIKRINKCLPKAWEVSDANDAVSGGDGESQGSTLQTILDMISKVINFACKFKDKIKSLFDKKMRLYNKKLFLQKVLKIQKNLGLFDSIKKIGGAVVNKVKDAGKAVGNAVADAAKKVGNAVGDALAAAGDWAKKGWDQLTSLATAAIGKFKEAFAFIKDKVQKIFASDFVQKVLGIVECVKGLKEAGTEIYNVIKGIYEKITTIISGGLVGLAKVFIDLICNFDIFRKAVENLIKGLKEKSVKKFNFFGQFGGGLIRAIGSKKLRLMKLYNL